MPRFSELTPQARRISGGLRLAAARNSGTEIIWCLASDRATETEMEGVIPHFLRPLHAILWAVMGFNVTLGDNTALHSSLLE